MNQFSCGQFNYRAGVLDARAQFHIVRRLTPFIKGVAPIIAKLDAGADASNIDPKMGMEALPELAEVLANLDDETADYVIFGLLKIVTREQAQGLGWAPVSKGNQLMFDDINMSQMLTLAGRALAANLGDFFAVLNSAFKSLDPSQKTE